MTVVLFLLVFAPYFILFGYAIPVGYLAYLCVFLFCFLRKDGCLLGVTRDPVFCAITAFSIVCATFLFFNSIRRGDVDVKLLRLVIDPYVIYFAARYIFFHFIGSRDEKGIIRLIEVLTVFNVLNAAVIYLSFVSEGFNSLFYGFVQVNPKIFEYPVPRFSGFLYDGFSYASTLMSLITITCYVLYIKVKNRYLAIMLLMHVFTIPASLLAGRTGIVILFAYFAFVFLLRSRDLFLFLFKPRSLILLICTGLALGILIEVVYGIDGPIGEYFRYSTRFITTFFDDSGYSDYTTQELAENHFYLPDDTLSLFVGRGYLVDWPVGVIRPDPAITLGVFAFGIIGFIVFLGVLLSPLVGALKKRNRVNYSRGQYLGLLLAFLILLFKDAYIFYPYPHFFMYFLCTLIISRLHLFYAR